MTTSAAQTTTDPLGAFVAGAFIGDTRRPIPLVSTSFDVQIDAGIAIVACDRVFRNAEPDSIEATITFPVPVHAVQFQLEARIDGRLLKAQARPRFRARDTYEDAIERGKTTVLHEEVLRGVHMLSVAHIPPGATVEISTVWAIALTVIDGDGHLRIPVTVGDIYGRSPLSSSDDFLQGGPIQTARVTVHCYQGSAALATGQLNEGRAQVRLDAPIDFVITGWNVHDLHGLAADGREVVLRLEPNLTGGSPLDVAVLIDHSGSMAEIYRHDFPGCTKHRAVVDGLKSIANKLSALDFLDLWEFGSAPTHVGGFTHTGGVRRRSESVALSPDAGETFIGLVNRLREPTGGTEIGGALKSVVGQSASRDVLLITDGKSHALDVHAFARMGRRVTVVLIGEDSLEANVGHLAALTGGDVFVATCSEATASIAVALNALRRPRELSARVEGELRELKASRCNNLISAEWRAASGQVEQTSFTRGIAAFAASLALPALGVEAATKLAEVEGLVTHLTSLVLVDETGEVQEGVPATRKVALSSPRRLESLESAAFSLGTALSAGVQHSEEFAMWRRSPVEMIDWNESPSRLVAGDLSGVDPVCAEVIASTATIPEVVDLAARLKISAVAFVVALLALSCGSRDRAAVRVAKAILGTNAQPDLEALGKKLRQELLVHDLVQSILVRLLACKANQ